MPLITVCGRSRCAAVVLFAAWNAGETGICRSGNWRTTKNSGVDIAGLEIDALELDGLDIDGLEIAGLDSRRSNNRIQEWNLIFYTTQA